MRVLLTGGAGFIGSRFVRRLVDSGDEVVVLDKLTYAGSRDNLEGVPHTFYEGDIADAETVAAAAAGCEAINVRELRHGSRWGDNRGFESRRSRFFSILTPPGRVAQRATDRAPARSGA
jgi:nucleoside-diphosphate-sugar epimerase